MTSTTDPTVKTAWVSLPIQFFGGGAVLGVFLTLIFLFAAGATYDGMLSLIGAAISGALLAIVCIFAATLLGLPLRLVRPLRHWWVGAGWSIPLFSAVIGMIGVGAAYVGPWSTEIFVPSDGSGIPSGMIREPNLAVFFTSLALASLGLAHLMFQRRKP